MGFTDQTHRCRHRRGRAISRTGDFVRERIGHRKYGRPRHKHTVRTQSARGMAAAARHMPILKQRLAFLVQLISAKEAGSARDRHGPRYPLADAKFLVVKIASNLLSTPAFDPANDFVTEYTVWRCGTASGKSVEIAAAQSTAGNTNQRFARQ